MRDADPDRTAVGGPFVHTSGPDTPPRAVLALRAAGTSLVLETRGPDLPRVLHWGRDLGPQAADPSDPHGLLLEAGVSPSAPDRPRTHSLLPLRIDGWSGAPGLEGHRAGRAAPVRLETRSVQQPSAGAIEVTADDPAAGVRVRLFVDLDRAGTLRLRADVTNTGDHVLDLAAVRLQLPLPTRADELLDLTGRWAREASPQRRPLGLGDWRLASGRGRTGHDGPLFVAVGTTGFGFRSGEVWAAHVAWSGDREHVVTRLPEGAGGHAASFGGGERLAAGEVRLEPGATHHAPEVWFAWSDRGLDGVSDRWHASLRSRPGHPRRPRPVTLNTWEAVYFDHDLTRLTELATVAADVGVERLVLDDGWFLGRVSDQHGLGDWEVDPRRWPSGLHPLADHVRALGLELGVWVEPEMVSPASRLAAEHPDWLLGRAEEPGPAARHQLVLDLANPEAYAHVLDRLDDLVRTYRLDALKWDHNRDLHAVVDRDGRPAVHRQTLATYRLVDELRRRHPALEIESCAAGGARVDLGMLGRTDRVWASDTNDPVERQAIQRWTTVLVPPELVGCHVGGPVAHTTGRATSLTMRGLTALFGHAGVEWDLTATSADERRQLAAVLALHKDLRPLLHSGDVVRADLTDEGALLHGVVAQDRAEAALAYVRLASSAEVTPGRVRLPGLASDRSYSVRVCSELGGPWLTGVPPAWWGDAAGDGLTVSGEGLTTVGLQFPSVAPQSGFLLRLREVAA